MERSIDWKRIWNMIKKYEQWVNESLSERGQAVARAFIEKLKSAALEGGKFEDWWSVSGRDYDESDIAYLDSLERIERGKPEAHRYRGEVYTMEFKVHTGPISHGYALGSLDTRDFKLHLNPSIGKELRPQIEEIYEEVLREHHPTEHTGRKYGI